MIKIEDVNSIAPKNDVD